MFYQNMLPITAVGPRIDNVDDPDPGSSVAGAVEPRFPGVLGGIVGLTKAQAAKLSSTSTPLFEGAYQYVKFKAGTTAAPTRGFVLYWDDFDDFVVTPDAPADARSIAGICLNSVTKGNHGFMQVAGRAQVKMRSSVTSTTIGNIVVVVDDDNVGDGIATGTTVTGGILTRWLGTAAETLVNSAVNQVLLRGLFWNAGL